MKPLSRVMVVHTTGTRLHASTSSSDQGFGLWFSDELPETSDITIEDKPFSMWSTNNGAAGLRIGLKTARNIRVVRNKVFAPPGTVGGATSTGIDVEAAVATMQNNEVRGAWDNGFRLVEPTLDVTQNTLCGVNKGYEFVDFARKPQPQLVAVNTVRATCE